MNCTYCMQMCQNLPLYLLHVRTTTDKNLHSTQPVSYSYTMMMIIKWHIWNNAISSVVYLYEEEYLIVVEPVVSYVNKKAVFWKINLRVFLRE